MKDINEYRSEIDRIDEQLIDLFAKRMDIAKEIADWKKKNGYPIYDSERERKLLNKVSELAGEEYKNETRVLYSTIMDISKSTQAKRNRTTDPLMNKIENAIKNTDREFPDHAIVACQGVEGAYSQLACEKVFNHPDIMYFNSFEAVFKAVSSGLCRYGILPLENSTAGSVNKVYDLMSKYNFYIVKSIKCRINHELLANQGSSIDDITEVVSHEQAINQCSQFFADHKNIKITFCENTAVAAKIVAESGRKDLAAISSSSCARQYGLKVLSSEILDNGGNDTRFICISKNLEIYPGSDKTSIKLTLPHKPGSLYHILSRFYVNDINIIKLESRPIPGKDFEFKFYFDAGVSVYSDSLVNLLSELNEVADELEYLGSYLEIV